MIESTQEPVRMGAGETFKFRKSLPGWTIGATDFLLYRLLGKKNYSVTASPGANWNLLHAAPATTAAWEPGVYRLMGIFTDTALSKSVPIYEGSLDVMPSISGDVTQIDRRTHAERALSAIEAVLENRATHEQASYTIAGLSVARRSAQELIALHRHYTGLVNQERLLASQVPGSGASGRVIEFKLK